MLDVVIVGAGFAGISAALELERQGYAVELYEALARVGGRTHTQLPASGPAIDLGGQFFNRDMHRIRALAASCGMTVYERPRHGVSLEMIEGQTRPAQGPDPFQVILAAPTSAYEGRSVHDVITRANLNAVDQQLVISALTELLSGR